jgi:adenylate kinase
MSTLLESSESQRIKAQGGMVDDAVVLEALLTELSKPQYRRGVVVDGFPRTGAQAEYVSQLHDHLASKGRASKYLFVMLYVDEAASVRRQMMRGRAVKELNVSRRACGLPPLEARATDTSEAYARTRYRLFSEQLASVVSLAARFPLAVVDASGSLDTVRRRIASTLNTGAPLTGLAKALASRLTSTNNRAVSQLG